MTTPPLDRLAAHLKVLVDVQADLSKLETEMELTDRWQIGQLSNGRAGVGQAITWLNCYRRSLGEQHKPYRPRDASAFQYLIEHFRAFLAAEHAKRDSRPGMGPDGPAWLTAEMEALLQEINLRREMFQFPPIDMGRLRKVERMASGHSDYASKLGLFAAELAMDKDPRP